MKYNLSLIFFGIVITSQAQDKIKFTYDNLSGNQIKRELCINCLPPNSQKNIKEIEAVMEEDHFKFFPEDAITYSPNPVKEELYIRWNISDNNYVSLIQVISINGQILKSYENKKDVNSQNILFQNYPAGVYIVSLSYLNGEQKTIKIIKQ